MDKVTFRVHEDGWVMVSELFKDKVLVRALDIGRSHRVQDTRNQHRCNEVEVEGTIRIRPKRYDITEFCS